MSIYFITTVMQKNNKSYWLANKKKLSCTRIDHFFFI